MKGIIAFAVICLIAGSVTVTGEQHSNNQYGLLSKENRAGECTTTCTTSGPSTSSNWILRWDNYVFVYNADMQFFGIFSIDINIALVFDVNSRTIGFFNVTTGAGIVFNTNTSNAIFIAGSGAIAGSASGDFGGVFEALIVIVRANAGVLAVASNNTGNSFDLSVLLSQIRTNADVRVAAIFQTRAALAVSLNAAFSVVFSNINAALTAKTVDLSSGAIVVLAGVLQVKIAVGLSLFNLFVAIYEHAQINLFITAQFFAQVRLALISGAAASVSASLNSIAGAINLVGLLYINANAALTAIIAKTVPVVRISIVVVAGVSYRIFTSTAVNKSFIIRITTVASANLDVIISYDSVQNFLAVFNQNLGYVALFAGNAGYWGLCNVRTGVVMAIKRLTGLAILIETSSAAIIVSFAAATMNMQQGFQTIASVVAAAGISIGSLITGSVFSLSTIVAALRTSSSSFVWGISVLNSTVRASLVTNFQTFFAYLNVVFAVSYSASFGAFNVLAGFFAVQLTVLINGFIRFALGIYTSLSGFLSVDALAAFFLSFEAEVAASFIGNYFAFLVNTFNVITSIVTTLAGAVSAAASAFVGFIATASASGGVSGGASGGISFGK